MRKWSVLCNTFSTCQFLIRWERQKFAIVKSMIEELPAPLMKVGLFPILQQDKLLLIRNLLTISPRLSVDGQFHTVLCALESVPINTSMLPTLRMRSISSLGRLGTLQSRYKLTRKVSLLLIFVWQTIMSFEQNWGTFQETIPLVTRSRPASTFGVDVVDVIWDIK